LDFKFEDKIGLQLFFNNEGSADLIDWEKFCLTSQKSLADMCHLEIFFCDTKTMETYFYRILLLVC
jgi:hypothetical protein